MYTFVRIASINSGKKGCWYFKPNSVEQVKEHFKTIFGKEISAGIRDKMQGYKHPDTAWRHGVDSLCNVRGFGWDCHGLPWLETAISLENEVLHNRINDFLNGVECFLANGVQQFAPSWKMYEITETVEKETLEYPVEEQFHLEDVRYSRWDMPGLGVKGVHWYAKIGNLDIRDKDGNMKWNTKEEAEEAARWFCQELNWKHYFAHKDE